MSSDLNTGILSKEMPNGSRRTRTTTSGSRATATSGAQVSTTWHSASAGRMPQQNTSWIWGSVRIGSAQLAMVKKTLPARSTVQSAGPRTEGSISSCRSGSHETKIYGRGANLCRREWGNLYPRRFRGNKHSRNQLLRFAQYPNINVQVRPQSPHGFRHCAVTRGNKRVESRHLTIRH